MLAARCHRHGAPGVLVFEEVADPVAKAGQVVVELAVVLGARVTAVASTGVKRRPYLAQNAYRTVDSEAPDLKEQLKAATSGGSDVVVDPTGGHYSEAALRTMR
jgi:NADPH2:quinone reductase